MDLAILMRLRWRGAPPRDAALLDEAREIEMPAAQARMPGRAAAGPSDPDASREPEPCPARR